MSRLILLDTGPLGLLARRHPSPALVAWTERLSAARVRLAIPEICDYELRREYLRAGLKDSLSVLDALPTVYDYVPLDTQTMRLAATLWAQVRMQGRPTADLKALDGDVILAAQARLLLEEGHDVTVASANVGHLALLVPSREWSEILPLLEAVLLPHVARWLEDWGRRSFSGGAQAIFRIKHSERTRLLGRSDTYPHLSVRTPALWRAFLVRSSPSIPKSSRR